MSLSAYWISIRNSIDNFLDQTPIEQFNLHNTFDSQGLTQLTEQMKIERKEK